MPQTFISFENASIRKFDKIVLHHINWTIQTDQHWAIIGENGSGKTTLTEAVMNRCIVAEGKIRFDFLQSGQFVKDSIELVPRDYSANRILQSAAQYYQQRFNADDAQNSPTVREFLTDQMKPIGTIDEKSVTLPPPSCTEEELQEISKILRISHLLDRKIMTLSNGETRRTLITKSLLKRPKMIILDTPFMGIDAEGRKLLHEAINHIAETGIQILLITSPEEIPDCITDIISLKEGLADIQEKKEKKDLSEQAGNTFEIDHTLMEHEPATDFEYAVRMRHVSVSYGQKKVLQDINWEVKRGERWALLGPNGSGKSTLLSLINADNPQSYANNFDLFDRKRGTGESIWDIKSRIGFVSPELHLYFTKKTEVYKAVASGLFNTNGLFQALKPAQRELAESYLKLLKIDHLSEKRFSEISTGEQRLVLLARALVKNPPLLVLDEPCQGLDHSKMEYFKAIVEAVCESLDKTLIFVTHYAEEIPNCVDKVLRLDNGVGEIGTLR